MIDYSDYESKIREPPENFRISKRGGYPEPDKKPPKSGVTCPDCTSDYQHCTWWSSDQNKNWGKECEGIIKNKKCPRRCEVFRTSLEWKNYTKRKELEIKKLQKELRQAQKEMVRP